MRDKSGRYEELEAYTTKVLGFEVAILAAPENREYRYQVLIQTFDQAGRSDSVIDLSEYLLQVLERHGFVCSV